MAEPHTITPKHLDTDGRLYGWVVTCPEKGRTTGRSCLSGFEDTDCEFDRWELGDHHDSCPDEESVCLAAGTDHPHGLRCWPYQPDECPGWNWDGMHLHPEHDRCGLQDEIDATGEVGLDVMVDTPSFPLRVLVRWDSSIEGYVLKPVTAEAADG